MLRHTFCSHLAMRGAPARVIQQLAGHQDLATTQRYMNLSSAAVDNAIRLLESSGMPRSFGDISGGSESRIRLSPHIGGIYDTGRGTRSAEQGCRSLLEFGALNAGVGGREGFVHLRACGATADLIVSMSHPSPDLGVSSLACHPKLAEFMRAKDGGPSGTGFATGLSTPLPSKRRTADHCSSSTRRRQPSTSPVTSASAGYFAEARRFTSSNQLITTLTCVAACSGSSCCGRRNRRPSGNTS